MKISEKLKQFCNWANAWRVNLSRLRWIDEQSNIHQGATENRSELRVDFSAIKLQILTPHVKKKNQQQSELEIF